MSERGGNGLESDELPELSERLHASRPHPSSTFLHRLGRVIEAGSPVEASPPHIRVQIAGFALAGFLLLASAAAITFL